MKTVQFDISRMGKISEKALLGVKPEKVVFRWVKLDKYRYNFTDRQYKKENLLYNILSTTFKRPRSL